MDTIDSTDAQTISEYSRRLDLLYRVADVLDMRDQLHTVAAPDDLGDVVDLLRWAAVELERAHIERRKTESLRLLVDKIRRWVDGDGWAMQLEDEDSFRAGVLAATAHLRKLFQDYR